MQVLCVRKGTGLVVELGSRRGPSQQSPAVMQWSSGAVEQVEQVEQARRRCCCHRAESSCRGADNMEKKGFDAGKLVPITSATAGNGQAPSFWGAVNGGWSPAIAS